jgi:hypothetical protein
MEVVGENDIPFRFRSVFVPIHNWANLRNEPVSRKNTDDGD